MTREKKTAHDFETVVKELEETVRKLELGNLSLEETIKLYERGKELSATCKTVLAEAERKVKILAGNEENPS